MRLRWTDRALADVHRHWMFLADRDVGYADRVEARLERGPALCCVHRIAGDRCLEQNCAQSPSPDIQHVLIYRIDAAEIVITAVESTREDQSDDGLT